MVKTYTGARLVTGGQILSGYDVVTENGMITDVCPHMQNAENARNLDGLYLAPGFIDLHVHGAGGYEFIDGTEEAFLRACEIHAKRGTRALFPTISATDTDTMVRALETAGRIMKEASLLIPGIHLEGPYLAPEMCGGQDAVCIRKPDEKEYLPILERFAPIIARWSYAPEHDDGSFLNALKRFGVVLAIAHSAAEYSHILPAYENGCKLVTHLYSCTSTVTRHGGFRHLGVIESAYLLDDMDVEAIADGCHIPPELMRMIVKIKTPKHTALITDAIRYAGMENAENLQGGTARIPYVVEDGVAKLSDRSAFAGSIATTEQLLKRTCSAGIPLADVVTMLTETPARIMHLTDMGLLAPGKRVLLTAFDENLNVVSID